MNSSNKGSSRTLARISPQKAKTFLTALANLENLESAARRFALHYGAVFRDELPTSLIYNWAIRGEEEGVVDLSEDQRIWKYWLVPLRDAVRFLWTSDLRTKQWGIFRILEKFFARGVRGLAVGPVTDDVEWFCANSLGPVTTCERIFTQLIQRTSICGNFDCPAPYFFARRRSQKYCSGECAAPAQREFKRKWWSEHGPKWRASRAAAHKERPRRIARKSRKGKEHTA
jgi:hypothetical protein